MICYDLTLTPNVHLDHILFEFITYGDLLSILPQMSLMVGMSDSMEDHLLRVYTYGPLSIPYQTPPISL